MSRLRNNQSIIDLESHTFIVWLAFLQERLILNQFKEQSWIQVIGIGDASCVLDNNM